MTAPKTASTTSGEVRMTRRIVVEVYATAHEADLALQVFEQVAAHLNATARYVRDVVSAPSPAPMPSVKRPARDFREAPCPLCQRVRIIPVSLGRCVDCPGKPDPGASL